VPALTAFHIGYAGRWPMDEFPYAQQVTRRAGVRLREVTLDPADLPELLPTVVEHLGQPNADPITVSTFALFRAVHQDGFKVALTGDAADEIFGGYDRFRAALNAGADWAPGYLRSLAACPQPLRDQLYSRDYRDHLRRAGTEHDRLAAAAGDDPLAFLAEVEVGDRLPAYHLRRVDHLSMASAVEVRLPFCQPAVVRLAAALPAPLRVTPTQGKRALYAAATGLLPDAVLTRPKQPFTLPLTMMTRPGQPLLDYLRTVLDPAEVRLSGLLDVRAVQALLRRHTARPTDTSALALWSLAVFQLWHRRFVVSPRPAVAVPA
jgi:asparagine synthase (glutamine-hydrolysing)